MRLSQHQLHWFHQIHSTELTDHHMQLLTQIIEKVQLHTQLLPTAQQHTHTIRLENNYKRMTAYHDIMTTTYPLLYPVRDHSENMTGRSGNF